MGLNFEISCLKMNENFTLKTYHIFAYKALSVPETAKTCMDAPLHATLVTVANEALTEAKDESEVRITKIFRSPSKLIKVNSVKLAPTSPYILETAVQTASINSRLVGKISHSNCRAK